MTILFLIAVLAAVIVCVSWRIVLPPPKISILGDSYSTFKKWIPEGNSTYYPCENPDLVTRVEECWWHIVLTALHGKLEKNESWSGSTICHTGYGGNDFKTFSFVTRAGKLGDPTLIFICGGTNDSWAESPIGEFKWDNWSVDELYTFRPAMAKMLADIKSFYPQTQVFFILNSGLKQIVNDSVHEICAHYNVKCVDLADIEKHENHPTVNGMKSIAAQVIKALE